MKIETVDGDFMISSFDLSPDDLVRVACACCSALIMLHPSPHLPKLLINDYDDYYGNSVWVQYRYQKKLKIIRFIRVQKFSVPSFCICSHNF